MKTNQQTLTKSSGWFGLGALLAATGASACCVAPLLLLSLGIGGAWVSNLTAMEAVRPFFIILTLVFIGLGYRQLVVLPEYCEEGKVCTSPKVKRNQRLLFWIGSGFLLMLLAFPGYAPFFMT